MFRGAVPKLSLDELFFCLQLASGVVQGKVPMTPPSKRWSIFPASYSRAPRDFEKRIAKLARKIQAREEDLDG